MDRLAEMAVAFVDVQLSHGARAFQLFDSWVGALSRRDYERFVLPHSRRVFAELAARHPEAPAIHFGVGCDHLLEAMWSAGAGVIGLDWRTPITEARRRLGPTSSCRATSTRPRARRCRRRARRRRARARRQRRAPGHIFNLGHGVLPGLRPGGAAGDRRPRPRETAAA